MFWIGLDGRQYLAHRLAFFYMTGEWPPHQIDHIDRDPANNRWPNLRPATQGQNNVNKVAKRTCDLPRGVTPNGSGYAARIKKNRVSYHLGTFRTPQEAHQAYLDAATKIHGEFLPTHHPTPQ
jgi:hypothetical protein